MQPDIWKERMETLWGLENVEKFQKAWVGVIGLGGVGSFALEAIARSGVGHIVMVDKDQVDITNINRQLPALHSTVGRAKTDVLKERVLDINPHAEVIALQEVYTAETSEKLLQYPFDYIVDAIDSIPDKLHLIQTCYQKKIPFISSMGMANRKDPTQLQITDLSKTEICPLCKKLRYELRKRGIEKGIRVVYSRELPENALQDKRKLGSCSFVPSVAGLYLASEVITHLAKNPLTSR